MKIQKTIKCAAAIVAVCLAAYTASANANIIGVNFVGNNVQLGGYTEATVPGGNTNIDNATDSLWPNQMAGVSSWRAANWNNYGRYGDGVILKGSNGVATTATMSWNAPDMWYNEGYTTVPVTWPSITNLDLSINPDLRLMDCFLESGWGTGTSRNSDIPPNSSIDTQPANNCPIIFLSGLSQVLANVGGGTYSIVIYKTSDNTQDSRHSEHWIQSASGIPTSFTITGDLTPHIFTVFTNQFYVNPSTNYIQVSPLSTNDAAATSGNYIVFDGLTNDQIIIRSQNITTSPAGAIGGFQILALGGEIPASATPPVPTPGSTIYGGSPVTLTENSSGNPPRSNQWQQADSTGVFTNIIGSNANTLYLILPNTGSQYTNKYQCIVTNIYNCLPPDGPGPSTSAVCSITVLPAAAPMLTMDIGQYYTNVYGFVGGNVNFHAEFGLGTMPITNQWLVKLDSGGGYTPVAGATGWYWTLTNVLSGSSGLYELAATNAIGRSNSTSAHLTALADPGAPTLIGTNMYSYCVYTNNPWAYWKFEETNDTFLSSMQAYDYSGHNFDATYGNSTDGTIATGCRDGAESIANGQYGPKPSDSFAGFPPTNGCAGLHSGAANGYLTVPPLNLPTNSVTFTMWIYPSSSSLVAVNTGLLMNRNGYDAAGVGFGGTRGGIGGTMPALGYTWNNNSSATYNWNSGLFPVYNHWNFAAWVMTPTNTAIYLYNVYNGQTNLFKAAHSLTNGVETFGGGTTWLGSDNWNNGQTFYGFMDEVAIFTNAMTDAQIQDLFLKGLGLNTGLPPSFTMNPSNVTMYAGQMLQLSAAAGGIPNPAYQWWVLNGASWTKVPNNPAGGISSPNASTLYWTNFSGYSNFRVVATNFSGSVTSTPTTGAVVTVLPVANWDSGLWTVNFGVTTPANNGPNTNYVGRGILGTNMLGYWNALKDINNFANTPPSLRDDGVTHSPVNLGPTNGNGNYSSGAPPNNNLLLDQYMNCGTNGTSMVFTGVPVGRYNLALYGICGSYANRGTTFTVQGVPKSVTNAQDVLFLPDNTVVYTNLMVTNGTLEVHIAPGWTPTYPDTNTEADFNGAQLELLAYGPNILSLTSQGGNFVLTYVGGKLLESTNLLSGKWTTNLTATSPFTIYPTQQMKFYRIYTNNF